MADLSRLASIPLSQPSLLSGISGPASPVICRTASTSPSASAAWDTTTPFRGSLIILREVLAELVLLAHALNEAVIQALGRGHSVPAQQGGEGQIGRASCR